MELTLQISFTNFTVQADRWSSYERTGAASEAVHVWRKVLSFSEQRHWKRWRETHVSLWLKSTDYNSNITNEQHLQFAIRRTSILVNTMRGVIPAPRTEYSQVLDVAAQVMKLILVFTSDLFQW